MNNALKLALDKSRMYVCMYVYISNGIASCLDSSCPADERRHSWNSQTDARQ
jgi:hypothetical protein